MPKRANKAKKPGNVRFDKGGPIRCMANAEGYVMVRRPGCAPFVLSCKEWAQLLSTPHELETQS